MTSRRSFISAAGAAVASAAWRPAFGQDLYWPGQAWETRDAAQAGFDAAALKSAVDAALADNSTTVLVLKGGRIVAETYAAGVTAATAREIASAGKSMLSVLVGVAIDEGKIKGLDQPASDFIPQWAGTAKQAITLRQLVTMTSGMRDGGLALRNVQGDQFTLNAGAALVSPPGTAWNYATAVYHLMFHVVQRAVGQKFEDFARRALVGPLGMEHLSWLTNQGTGPSGPMTNYYTALCSARDLGRFGLLALRGGRWGDRRLVSEAYLKAATSPSQALNPAYGYLWWTNAQPGFPAAGPPADGSRRRQFEGSPPDAFGALGAQGQVSMVVPSLDLVVVRQGSAPAGAARPAALLAQVCAAVRRS